MISAMCQINHKFEDMLLDRRIRDSLPYYKPPISRRSPTLPQGVNNEVVDAGGTEYRFEEVRLQSYASWPSPHVRPEDLAAAGFYYTKQLDRVRCFECGNEIYRWEEGDNPMSEHQRWYGRCRFVRKRPCGNVPLGADPSTIPVPPRPQSQDVCGPYQLDYRPGAVADIHSFSSSASEQQQQLGALGLVFAKKPKFPQKAVYEARLQSFKDWPTLMSQTKEQLAEAGLFYTGYSDETKCYQCGGGLKNWDPQDDPWTQHAKWYSGCYYVKLVKGQEFINSVTGKHVSRLSKEEIMNLNLPSFIKVVEKSIHQNKKSTLQDVEKAEEPEKQQSQLISGNATKPIEIQDIKSKTSIQMENDSKSLLAIPTISAQSGGQQHDHKKPIVDNVCKICCSEELGVIFLPCSHVVACVHCAPGLTTCAVCREPITIAARAFIT